MQVQGELFPPIRSFMHKMQLISKGPEQVLHDL